MTYFHPQSVRAPLVRAYIRAFMLCPSAVSVCSCQCGHAAFTCLRDHTFTHMSGSFIKKKDFFFSRLSLTCDFLTTRACTSPAQFFMRRFCGGWPKRKRMVGLSPPQGGGNQPTSSPPAPHKAEEEATSPPSTTQGPREEAAS